jgi:hypothetical protein
VTERAYGHPDAGGSRHDNRGETLKSCTMIITEPSDQR